MLTRLYLGCRSHRPRPQRATTAATGPGTHSGHTTARNEPPKSKKTKSKEFVSKPNHMTGKDAASVREPCPHKPPTRETSPNLNIPQIRSPQLGMGRFESPKPYAGCRLGSQHWSTVVAGARFYVRSNNGADYLRTSSATSIRLPCSALQPRNGDFLWATSSEKTDHGRSLGSASSSCWPFVEALWFVTVVGSPLASDTECV